MRYEHVLGFAVEHPWALTPAMHAVVAGILARHVAGESLTAAEIAAAVESRRSLPQPVRGGAVALIPIRGVIAPRANMLSDVSGGTTFEGLTKALDTAMADDTIKTIIFDVDSPGGNVAGATEFARAVMKARVRKPIIAQANFLMASAAYWPMACATEIVASPSALVGSVGVMAMHEDISAALEKLGVRRQVITAGKFKGEGADGGPLTDEALAHITGMVNTAYTTFLGDVAKGRGVTVAQVRAGYGEGRCIGAEQAKELGMVDRIGTLDDTLARVLTAPPRAGARASGQTDATDQEPSTTATSQEPTDARQFVDFEGALIGLDL